MLRLLLGISWSMSNWNVFALRQQALDYTLKTFAFGLLPRRLCRKPKHASMLCGPPQVPKGLPRAIHRRRTLLHICSENL